MTARERVTLVLPLYNQLALTRGCFDSLRATREPFRLVVIDNGSTDGTREMLRDFPYPYPLDYIENDNNHSVIASINRAWRRATTDVVCLLHNDTELVDPGWLTTLVDALDDPTVGMTGLYGAKRMRSDTRYVGRTIVHSLAEGPTVRPPGEDVSVIDSVCLCLRRALLEDIGGLDERYGFYHGFDKDLALAVRERGLRCRVMYAPFRHHGGGTRTKEFRRDPEQERRDLADRDAVIRRLREKWRHRLPADARPVPVRVREWVRAHIVYPWRP